MMFFSKNNKSVGFFKNLHEHEILSKVYKYFSEIFLSSSEIMAYYEYFKQCEKMGFSFYFYLIDEKEEERKIAGFSNFAIQSISDSLVLDLTYLNNQTIEEYIEELFDQDGYFIVSDNIIRKDTLEEFLYSNTVTRICDSTTKQDSQQPRLHLIKGDKQ